MATPVHFPLRTRSMPRRAGAASENQRPSQIGVACGEKPRCSLTSTFAHLGRDEIDFVVADRAVADRSEDSGGASALSLPPIGESGTIANPITLGLGWSPEIQVMSRSGGAAPSPGGS